MWNNEKDKNNELWEGVGVGVEFGINRCLSLNFHTYLTPNLFLDVQGLELPFLVAIPSS